GKLAGGASPCFRAFSSLIKSARANHIIISYSEEGLLARPEIEAIRTEVCGPEGFNPECDTKVIAHTRFRSDADRKGRNYRVVEGRERDKVGEFLFFARK